MVLESFSQSGNWKSINTQITGKSDSTDIPELIITPEAINSIDRSLPIEQTNSPVSELIVNYEGLNMNKDNDLSNIEIDIINALEKSGYYWRAIDSIAMETSVSEEKIRMVLKQLIKDHQIVVAPRRDCQGRVLYTTRKHYRETRGFMTKLLSALANQIVCLRQKI